ncbi:MAG: hypothetical protein LBJ02_07850 [Bifidobacteriaceae bacterium]|nr:hypothetical protein [Bifidobacteriaceae bacterium]
MIAAGACLVLSVPVAAWATTATTTGAKAETVGQYKVKVTDTAADNHAAWAYFYTNQLAPQTQYNVVTHDGNGSSKSSGTMANTIERISACAKNNNPFDANKCSSYVNTGFPRK